uniref:Uncharacterized protein n=1 Tax=Arundo donax TaxID=35708 RepID=A0A0A9BY08_ARUDO
MCILVLKKGSIMS